MSVIRFKDVSVKFHDEFLFENLDFELKRGDKLLVYGKSGEGKTTIIRLMLGFECPHDGTIFFEGHRLDRKTVWYARRKIAHVSQNLDIGDGPVRGLINRVMAFKANENIKPSNAELSDWLNFLRLKESILREHFEKLSGGEKQRIAILIALLLKRDVFLLDEVTSALDSELKEKVIDYFTSRSDATVIVISHDKDWLDKPGIRIINLDNINGRV
jgi:putative ABC transport system ATP-binding protein